MKKILIGGVDVTNSVSPLLKVGLNLSGRQKPRVLYVPTLKKKHENHNKSLVDMIAMHEGDLGLLFDE